MKTFVTGATGVLGKPVVRLLAQAGHQVYTLSRPQARTIVPQPTGVEAIPTDLFDQASLIKALETTKAEAIIHLATRIPPTTRMGKLSSWEENTRIREEGTRNLVNAALVTGVQTLIYPSFYFVYPDCGSHWIDALSTPTQSHPIQQATLDAEAEVARFSKAQRRGIVLRLGNLYGPEAPSAMEQLQMAQKGIATLLGPKDAYLSYIWVEDAARAMITALTEIPSGIYDIVDDEPVTRRVFAKALAQSVGKNRLWQIPQPVMKLLAGDAAEMASRSQRVSNRHFREMTTWKPTVSNVQEGWNLIAQAQKRSEGKLLHA